MAAWRHKAHFFDIRLFTRACGYANQPTHTHQKHARGSCFVISQTKKHDDDDAMCSGRILIMLCWVLCLGGKIITRCFSFVFFCCRRCIPSLVY